MKENELDTNPQQEELDENIVELVDEEGKTLRFELVMTLEHENRGYILLTPAEPMEEADEDELVIMRIETDEEGNDCYATLDDEDEMNAVYEVYLSIVDEEE